MIAVNELSAKHLADLEKSGLSPEQIAACGFASLHRSKEIARILRWTNADKLGSCLLIPYRQPDGSMIQREDFARLKPDMPRTDSKVKKSVRYESPKGSSARLYFPPRTCPLLADVAVSLLITEGEKKAAKADQEGFACVGLGGVDAWSKKREAGPDGKKIGQRLLLDDWDAVELSGREVFITFDSDLREKPSVQRAEFALAQALESRGAIVKVVRLPDGPIDAAGNPSKVGLDDFLVAHSAFELRALMDAALPPEDPGLSGLQTSNEAADDPHRLARLYIAERGSTADGEPTLVWWHNAFWRWEGCAYEVISDDELRAEISTSIKQEFDRLNLEELKNATNDKPPPTTRRVTRGLIHNVVCAAESLCILPGKHQQPCWLTTDAPFPADEVFATRSSLIHFPGLVSGLASKLPPTQSYFSANVVDYDFDADAECPNWLTFMDSLWGSDSQSQQSLQEWMGYLLLPDTRQQKLLLMIGPPRSGKGTICRTLKKLIGDRNVATPSLGSLAGQFGLWPLLGKTAAIIPEARLGHSADAVAVVEKLLSISGEDPQDIHRKNLPTLTGIRLSTRFVLMTNELPSLRDSSGAFANRVVMLRTTQSWLGREDKGLDARLESELAGILNWAIEGWARLHDRGYFLQPDSAKELLADLNDLSSPVSQFVRECCIVGPEFSTSIESLFSTWQSWCDEHGRQNSGTRETFGKDLRAKLPHLELAQPRTAGGGRQRVYKGVGLRDVGTRWNASQPIAREELQQV